MSARILLPRTVADEDPIMKRKRHWYRGHRLIQDDISSSRRVHHLLPPSSPLTNRKRTRKQLVAQLRHNFWLIPSSSRPFHRHLGCISPSNWPITRHPNMSTTRNAHAGPSTYVPRRIEDVAQEEKGEEELELEEVLFGRKRRRATATATAVAEEMDNEDEAPAFFYDGMGDIGGVGDLGAEDAEEGSEKQVSLSYFIKASLIPPQLFYMDSSVPNLAADAESSSESESEAEDGTRRQKATRRQSAASDSDSDSDSESAASSHDSRESASDNEQEEEDASPFQGGPTKRTALWHDPADDAVRVDLAADTRLRKLARGKTGREAVVGGKSLENKLREQ